MKDWRERHHGSSGTDFADPTTPNQTPGRKRGRVIAAARARADAAILATREMDQAHQDDYAEDDDDDYELREKKPAAKRARTTQPQGRDVVIIGDDEAVGDEPVNPNHNPEAKVGLMMPPSAYLNNNGQGLKQTGSEDSKDSVGLMNAPAHPSYGGGPQYGGLTPYNPVPPSPGRNGYAAPAYNNTNAYGPFTGNGYPNAGYDMGNQGPLGYNMHGNQGFTAQSPGSAYARPTNSFGFSPQANLEKNSNEDTEASDDVIFKRSRRYVPLVPSPRVHALTIFPALPWLPSPKGCRPSRAPLGVQQQHLPSSSH